MVSSMFRNIKLNFISCLGNKTRYLPTNYQKQKFTQNEN